MIRESRWTLVQCRYPAAAASRVSAFIVPGMAGETIAKRLQQKPTLACYAVVIRVVSGVPSVLLAK
jgi:hypothetical protein